MAERKLTKEYLAPFFAELRRLGFKREAPRQRLLATYVRTEGRRQIDVQLWYDGMFRASHMLDGRMCTYSTPFVDLQSMRAAILHERTRQDHPPAEMPRRARRKRVVLRPALALFAEEMELRLRRHDKKKGRHGWRAVPYSELYDLLHENMASAVDARARGDLGYVARQKKIGSEAIDLANICMMIFDVGHVPAR